MEVFQNVLNVLKTAITGLSGLVDWFINFSFDIGGFHVNSGVLLTAGFLGAVVALLVIHLVNVVSG